MALIRPIRDRSHFMQILMTTGIGLILTDAAQLIFKADYRQTNIDLINRSVHLGPFGANAAEVLSFAIAVAFVVGLRAFVVRSRTGQALRAISQNAEIAPLMGINLVRIQGISFALGTALAGIAGGLLLPRLYLFPGVGEDYTTKAFVMVVLGGMGSIEGAAFGGLVLGLSESLTSLYLGNQWALIIDFALFLLCSHSNQRYFWEAARMIGFKIGWKFWVGLIVLLLWARMPWFIHNNYQLQVLFRITLFAALGLAWNLVGGYAGQLSLGHVAFFGVGAYGLALFAELGIPVWISAFLAALVATAFRRHHRYDCLPLARPLFHTCHHCLCRSFALGRYQSERHRRSHRLNHARPLRRPGVLAVVLSRCRGIGCDFISGEFLGLALPLRLLPDGHSRR